MPTQISVHALAKSYGDQVVLDEVTFAIAPGERAGIIGENGSGKSTLLRLLAGREQPDDGRVTVAADGGVGYLAQDAPLPPHLSVRQAIDEALADLRAIEARLRELEPLLAGGAEADLNEYGSLATIFELRGGYDADARLERALPGLGMAGVDRDRRLGSLSGGERARLHLASVLAANPEVLLLDEPTNHLDDAALDWLGEHLRGRHGTTIVVSHDRVFLDRVATTLIEVDADRHTLVRYGGGYTGYLAERAAARRRWEQAYEQWRAEVDRLRQVAATTARQVAPGRAMTDRNKMAYDRAGGRVQQSIASRVRNAEQRLARLVERPVSAPPEPLRFTPALQTTTSDAPAMAGGPVATVVNTGALGAALVGGGAVDGGSLLAATDVTVDGRLRRSSLAVRMGDRVLVSGPNGAGKSTLLRVLVGDLAPEAGYVTRHGRIGYLPQEVAELHTSRPGTGSGETLLSAFARGRPGPTEEHRARLLALGLFDRDRLSVPVAALSTGQRQRLALARLLSEPADVLVLDEPTNHLSLGLVEELESALATYPGALIVVSHDRWLRRRWTGEHLELVAPTSCP